MAKRDALHELSRQFPAPREVEAIMDSLQDKDDLHVAIIAVSIVEATLEHLIVTRLPRTNKEFLSRLFQRMGPLSDFNSKILIAEAFGMLTGPLANELHVMRNVRNAFAHAKVPISFSSEAVEAELRRLRMIEAMKSVHMPIPEGAPAKLNLEGKSAFLLGTSANHHERDREQEEHCG
jgi:hypothetical protein